jgi:hypothetical protein
METRERVNREADNEEREDWRLRLRVCRWVELEVGANKSDRDPVRRRAMVDVNAIVVTCVEGRPAGGGASGG